MKSAKRTPTLRNRIFHLPMKPLMRLFPSLPLLGHQHSELLLFPGHFFIFIIHMHIA